MAVTDDPEETISIGGVEIRFLVDTDAADGAFDAPTRVTAGRARCGASRRRRSAHEAEVAVLPALADGRPPRDRWTCVAAVR